MATLFMCARADTTASDTEPLENDADTPSVLEYTDLVGSSVLYDLDLPDSSFQQLPMSEIIPLLDNVTKDESLLEDITYGIVQDIKRMLNRHRDTTHMIILKV